MRFGTPTSIAAAALWSLAALACERAAPAPGESPAPTSSAEVTSALGSASIQPRLASSHGVAESRSIQATKLRVPLERGHQPRLAFGRGVLGQLTQRSLRIHALDSFELIATLAIEEPRAVLSLADGALLVIGARAMLHYEPGNRRVTPRVRPALLWGDVYADAQRADRIWVFDGSGSSTVPATLRSFVLVEGTSSAALPEQTIELDSQRGGAFGVTREGVWLYLTRKRGDRLSPGGLRLPGLTLPEAQPPTRILPARRLEQAIFVDEAGELSRALVVPPFKRLGSPTRLAGTPYSMAVADEGRLIAATVVTGPGPRFELELLDDELRSLARVQLPSDPPTGGDDWLRVVTANQFVAASATRPLVAVGGPSRVALFNARGERIFYSGFD